MNPVGILRVLLGWVIAVLAAVVLGSVAQTQFNLARLIDLGAKIGTGERLATTWHDLVHFTPLFAILVAIAFAIAWPIAGLLKRWWPAHRTLLFVLAGGSAVWVMLAIMDKALPVTPIAAARSLAGSLSLVAAGLVAGWIYTRLIRGDVDE